MVMPAKSTIEPSPPTPSFLQRIESATTGNVRKLLGIPVLPNDKKFIALSKEDEDRVREIAREAIVNFEGDMTRLESALGMLILGHQVGWKVLYLIHSKKTIRAYEEILGVRIRDIFPETGPSSYRSIALNLADRFQSFWRVAGGDIKIPRRKETL